MLFLGIDVGTGGAKAILIDHEGQVRAKTSNSYPLSTPRPLWSEQDPGHWWHAVHTSVRQVLEASDTTPSAVAAVGLTGQMHGLVLTDRLGAVLRPAILWNDQRTDAECSELDRRIGAERLVQITGKPALPSFTAPKIMWVRAHEPDVYDCAASIMLPKDYVRFRLTGAVQCDVADASGTSLFDVGRRVWSDEIIKTLELPPGWLPEVFESAVPSAAISAAGAEATGLMEGTPVVAGAGDQAAEAIGCGIVEEGVVSVTVGTSGVVFAAIDSYAPERIGALHAYCHAVPGAWHVMGVMLSAGGSLRWHRDTLGGEESAEAERSGADPYEVMIEDASNVPAGAEGLVFLPYLAGERTPHPDPFARGAFVGLTLRHTKAHLTRAVLEGVTFGLRDSLELTRALGVDVSRVRVSGGGARSGMWRQMMADVFDADVATVNVAEGAAYGAAILASVGAQAFPSVREAVRTLVRETGTISPGPDARIYADQFERYRALYPALRDEFRRLAGS